MPARLSGVRHKLRLKGKQRSFSSLQHGEAVLTFKISLVLVAVISLASQAAEPLKLEQWLDWERATNPQIAPDGAHILFTRNSINKLTDRWDSQLWIMGADGSRMRYLEDGGSATWSPTGDRIAFVAQKDSRPQLFTRWMDEEGAVTQITRGDQSPSLLAWSPDGQYLAFRARVEKSPSWTISLPKPKGAKWTADSDVIEDLHYRQDRVGRKTWHDHIFIVPAEGGTPRQITMGDWDVGARVIGVIDARTPLVWSHDGSEVFFDGQVLEEGDKPDPWTSHIYAVSVEDGSIRQVTGDPGFWHSARLSQDGKAIAYTGSAPAETNYRGQTVRVVQADGSGDRTIIDELPAGLTSLHWNDASDGFYYTVEQAGRRNVVYQDLAGSSQPVTEGNHQIALTSVSNNGHAVGVITAPNVTRNIVTVDLQDGAIDQLTDLNSDILWNTELGPVEEFWTESSDNERVQGWIINPPNYDPAKAYPLMLAIHGGPHGDYGFEYRPMFQFFAAMGYVVVYSNPRGSTGYGTRFANEIDNRYPGRRDFDDLMAAVDAAIDRRNIDLDRLYVQGCSGGGVLTAWTVINTDRFAAAASRCPVINWISFFGQADITAWASTRFRPYHWENADRWLDHSPIMHVEKVKTPTLLMTGSKDLRTPLEQAEEFYAALKIRGVPTKLIVVQDEWHGTSSIPSNMLRSVLYMDKWFTEHGGGSSSMAGILGPSSGED